MTVINLNQKRGLEPSESFAVCDNCGGNLFKIVLDDDMADEENARIWIKRFVCADKECGFESDLEPAEMTITPEG